jgi:hypothetical protein
VSIRVVLARKPTADNNGSIVLVALFKGLVNPPSRILRTPDEFVTWWESPSDEATYNGHYTTDLTEAVMEYDKRER